MSGMTAADLSIDLMVRAVGSISAAGLEPMALYAPVPTNYD
jgi:hypothetical protein